MSDRAVLDLVIEMENHLNEEELPDPDQLAAWNAKFGTAAAAAERGPEWKTIVERAHALNDVIQKRLGGMIYERDLLRHELEAQALGQRALKGYSQ
jgi:hypothetical protein